MLVGFRQGLVRAPANFLQHNGNSVSLVVPSTDTVVLAVADGDSDYLISEKSTITNAWVGPFSSTTDYYLYWDIHLTTGARTFGYTTIEPHDGPTAPPNPVNGHHWFDTSTKQMKVYNSTNHRWSRVIRCFAAHLAQGSQFISMSSSSSSSFTGTQAGLNTQTSVGALIYDNLGGVLKKKNGTYFTTEDYALTGIAHSSQVKFGSIQIRAEAEAYMPALTLVQFTDFNKITYVSNHVIDKVMYGIIEFEANVGDIVNVTMEGVVRHSGWDFSGVRVNTPVFVDSTGTITLTPSVPAIPIGAVIDVDAILLRPSALFFGDTGSGGGGTTLEGTATGNILIPTSLKIEMVDAPVTPTTLVNKAYVDSLIVSSGNGYTGSVGYTGSQGLQGPYGFTGSSGAGYTGSQGDQGFMGDRGYTGSQGETGIGFTIAKTYISVAALQADVAPTGILPGQFAIIETGDTNNVENSRLYLWNGTVYSYTTDMSGGVGVVGPQGAIGYTGSASAVAGPIGYTGSGGVGYTGSASTIAGPVGQTGYTGSAGVDGVNGLTGYTGSAGLNGTAGYTGSASTAVGPMGYTGSQGDKGDQGEMGPQGIQGSSGDTGSQGPAGVQGIQGSTGYTGSQGEMGPQGIQGSTGAGYTGSASTVAGPQGIQGSVGYTGSQGEMGPQGIQGSVGDTGSQGIQGIQGSTGYVGSQGIQGEMGLQGIQGSQGDTGAQGPIGLTGLMGPIGLTGSAGATGYTGSKGDTGMGFYIAKTYPSVAALQADTAPTGINDGEFAIIETGDANNPENSRLYMWDGADYLYMSDLSGAVGITGATGATGYVGSQGVVGYVGYVGSKGDIGFTGSLGYTGSQGDTGYVGSASTVAGPAGTTGFTGSVGTTGFTGSASTVAGPSGSIGYTGSQGDIGPIGYVGSASTVAGPAGSIGFTGSTGYTGSASSVAGPAGATGFTGSAGTSGTNGTVGYTGSAGVGYTGSAGVGYTGSASTVAGPAGFTGSTGAGYTGSQGIVGYTGSAGTGGGGVSIVYRKMTVTANGATARINIVALGDQTDLNNVVATAAGTGTDITFTNVNNGLRFQSIAISYDAGFNATTFFSIIYPDLNGDTSNNDMVLPLMASRYNTSGVAVAQTSQTITNTGGIVKHMCSSTGTGISNQFRYVI